jgi:hypothetical protein
MDVLSSRLSMIGSQATSIDVRATATVTFTLFQGEQQSQNLWSCARDALCKYPNLALGIRGCESSIANWRHLNVSYISSSRIGPLVQGVHIVDVDMDQRRRVFPEGFGTRESLPRLADHHKAVVPQDKLGVGAAASSRLRQALFEPEGRFQVLDGAWGVLVQEVRRNRLVAGWWVPHFTMMNANPEQINPIAMPALMRECQGAIPLPTV